MILNMVHETQNLLSL